MAVRIDKYLWSIRAYKTRSEATEACKGNKVKVSGVPAKPSHLLKEGDLIEVRKGAVQYTYRVKALIENRIGARLLDDFVENLTPRAELDKLSAPQETVFLKRDRGTGRPTKKERRSMASIWDSLDSGFEEDE